MKSKWLAAPLATLFLLFSTGVAAAPECHIESKVQTISQSEVLHSKLGHSHSHADQISTSATSNAQETLLAVGSTLGKEICIAVGFIVLLFLRFSRGPKSRLSVKQFSLPKYQLPQVLSKNISYLNLNHLQLGIIRI